MTRCEKLQALLQEALDEDNDALAAVLEQAMNVAGCNATPQSGGGNGDPPPEDPGG